MRRTEILHLRLRCDTSAPRLARRAVARLEAIASVRDDAVLVASELAAHAVTRTGAEPDDEIELRAQLIPDGVRLAISNERRSRPPPSPRLSPPVRRPSGRTNANLRRQVLDGVGRRSGADRGSRPSLWVELAL